MVTVERKQTYILNDLTSALDSLCFDNICSRICFLIEKSLFEGQISNVDSFEKLFILNFSIF